MEAHDNRNTTTSLSNINNRNTTTSLSNINNHTTATSLSNINNHNTTTSLSNINNHNTTTSLSNINNHANGHRFTDITSADLAVVTSPPTTTTTTLDPIESLKCNGEFPPPGGNSSYRLLVLRLVEYTCNHGYKRSGGQTLMECKRKGWDNGRTDRILQCHALEPDPCGDGYDWEHPLTFSSGRCVNSSHSNRHASDNDHTPTTYNPKRANDNEGADNSEPSSCLQMRKHLD
nr:hypothetical protein BaRGS_034792 [Batillaria attramentaria]